MFSSFVRMNRRNDGLVFEFTSGLALSVIWSEAAYCSRTAEGVPISFEVAIFDETLVDDTNFKLVTNQVFADMVGYDIMDDVRGWQSPQEVDVLIAFLTDLNYQRMLKAGRLLA